MNLSDAEIMEVYKEDEREGIRLMVDKYQNYVWHVINMYYPTFSYEKADLFQNGVIGIMVAMKRYIPERGSFMTYCTPFIKKEIGKQLRFITNESSDYFMSIHSMIERAITKLELNGQVVSVDSVMAETHLSRKIVTREMKVDFTNVSLEAIASMGKDMELSDDFMIDDILAGIPSENQEIFRKKMFNNLTFKQIAEDMHMSAFRVQRRYNDTIDVLKAQALSITPD